MHQGSDINPEYVEYVYNVYIINIIIIILITALRQYMTVYIQKNFMRDIFLDLQALPDEKLDEKIIKPGKAVASSAG